MSVAVDASAPVLVAAALVLSAVAVLPGSRAHAARVRWRALFPPPAPAHPRPRPLPVAIVALVGGGGVALLLGGWWGAVLGAATWVAVRRVVPRLEPASARRRRQALAAQAPDVLDLLVACLVSGSTVPAAVEATAAAVAAPARDVLGVVAAQLRLGADPASAWAPVAGEAPFASLAAAVSRAADSGAALATALADAADDLRAHRRSEVESAARRIGVRLTAPLGLAFLPAFVLLGIVPVVASLIAGALALP